MCACARFNEDDESNVMIFLVQLFESSLLDNYGTLDGSRCSNDYSVTRSRT